MKWSVPGKETSVCEGPEGGRAPSLSEPPQVEHFGGITEGDGVAGADCLSSSPSSMF